MALLPAICPECRGFIEVDSEKRLGVCLHCKEPFVVEEAIQIFNSCYNITNNYNTNNNFGDGSVVNIYEDASKDFVIEAGVLKEYHGASADVVIPDGVAEIGESCFKDSKIKSVSIPNSVTSIGRCAFHNCTSLTSVTIPDSVTSIGYEAFSWCSSLDSVTIGDGVTSIAKGTFSRCTSLTSVTIPDSVTSIGDFAFSCCSRLASDTIPRSVTSMGDRDFGDYWEFQGLCSWCGGEFEGVVGKKCTRCGKPKNY